MISYIIKDVARRYERGLWTTFIIHLWVKTNNERYLHTMDTGFKRIHPPQSLPRPPSHANHTRKKHWGNIIYIEHYSSFLYILG